MVNLSCVISASLSDYGQQWDTLAADNLYLSSTYLNLVEDFGPIGFSFYYVIVYAAGEPVGIVYCQRKRIILSKDFRLHTHEGDSLWERLKVSGTKFLFSFVRHDILICGNVILTGEYGFKTTLNAEQDANLIPAVLEKVRQHIRSEERVSVKSTLVKDFYIEGPLRQRKFGHSAFHAFKVQPDMVVSIREEWQGYADYLSAVKSKYRVKFKKVNKKGAALEFRAMDAAMADNYSSQMYKMYEKTAARASFSLFLLGERYFSELKKTLGDKLSLTGVFLGDELVAFFTLIKIGKIADAHFLGYDVKLNSQYQIYFNILLLLVEQAIEMKASHLNLSRTALEIKSSVGAEPLEMNVHFRYHNGLIQKLIPQIMKTYVPEDDWLQRKPFK